MLSSPTWTALALLALALPACKPAATTSAAQGDSTAAVTAPITDAGSAIARHAAGWADWVFDKFDDADQVSIMFTEAGANPVSVVRIGNAAASVGVAYASGPFHEEAFRHMTWQAMMTVNFGELTATECGNIHEEQSFAYAHPEKPWMMEDSARDQIHNRMGRMIGRNLLTAHNAKYLDPLDPTTSAEIEAEVVKAWRFGVLLAPGQPVQQAVRDWSDPRIAATIPYERERQRLKAEPRAKARAEAAEAMVRGLN